VEAALGAVPFYAVTLNSTNSPVNQGEIMDFTATIDNTEPVSGNKTVELQIATQGIVDSQNLQLGPNSSKQVTLSWDTTGATAQDYVADLQTEDDSVEPTVTVEPGTTLFGFETGDTSRWDTATALSVISGSPSFNSGSFIGDIQGDGVSTAATVVPSALSGGGQISKFEYYWKEEEKSYGGAARLRNSNGNVELSTSTNNPQWTVQDANGITQVNDGNANYNDWTRFTVTFDWSAGTFDIDFKNLATGLQETQTGFPLIQGVDIEEVELSNYNNGGFSDAAGHYRMQCDDITFVG